MQAVLTPPRLAPRPPNAHKASVGGVLVIGGSRDLAGAVALAALGALRAGAGLVRVAVPRSIQARVAGFTPETTSAGLSETAGGALAREAAEEVLALASVWDAVVLGPGAGREPDTVALLLGLVRSLGQPLVLDADGLYAVAGHLDLLAGRTAPTVITPHEGEAARLLGLGADDVRRDREEAAARLAAETGAVVVLKGPGTLVTDGRRLFRSGTGGPVLASGGTGDVLAGVVGAFLAGLPGTGGDPFGAAAAAVHVHGAAADRLGAGLDRGVLASEVAAALPQAVATLVRASGGAEGTS